jgi:hypothetical protein
MGGIASSFIASGLERACEHQDVTDIMSNLRATHSVPPGKSMACLSGRSG